MLQKPKFWVFSLSILSLWLTGCGNHPNYKDGGPVSDLYRATSASTSSGSTTINTTGYSCIGKDNILPRNFEGPLNGAGRYEACGSITDSQSALVHGFTEESSEICVVPAQQTADGSVYLQPDFASGAKVPQIQCIQVGDSGAKFTFKNTSYNAMIVLDGKYKTQMYSCLPPAGNWSNCPHYSYGKFR